LRPSCGRQTPPRSPCSCSVRARGGDYRARSDVDLLVVVPAGTDTRRAAAAIDALLPVTGVEVDVLVATPARLAAARGDCGSVLHWVQEQGVALYRADADDSPRSTRDGASELVDGAETPVALEMPRARA